MEGSNSVRGTPEYVIQLQEDVLQGQDLEHVVNLAVINSTPNQVTYIVAAEEVAAVDDDCSKATEHRDDHSQVQGSVNQQQDTDKRNSNRNLVVVENVPENENMADLQSSDSDDSVIKQPPQESDVAKQIIRELTELGSETSVTSSNVTDVKDKKEIKAAKRREISLLNKKLATIPKRPSVLGDGDQVGLEVQPFTVETLKSYFPESRSYNKTRTIYDFLMYEKFPEGYTKNQKQGLRDIRDNYIIVDKKLYYRQKKNNSIYLLLVIHDERPDMQLEILQDGHMTKAGSHLGINRTIAQIKDHFYWHGMTEHVRAFIKSCQLCCLKHSVAKERDKWVQVNMQTNSNFGSTPEGISMSERVDSLSNELRRQQNNLNPFESHVWLQKLKDEVTYLNYSISLHKHQKQMISGEFPKVVTKKVDNAGDNSSSHDNNILIEPVCPCPKGDNAIYSTEKDEIGVGSEVEIGGKGEGSVNVGVNPVRKEMSSKEEELKMLETMLPRNREHNHSRLIEEIIRTNKYPEQLTPGQIVGLAQVKTHYIMINDELYRVFSKRGKMQNVAKVIHDDEPGLKRKIMKACHVEENGKHNGMNKTICRVNAAFHWHSMSMHIRIFLEYCPICRYKRGLNKPSVASSHVARTNDISDICRKIANIPKDVYQAVPDNLDLTPEDYQEVKQLAEEVKDLNAWLFKNPTIKEEWEYMYESNSRGSQWFNYDKRGKGASVDKGKSRYNGKGAGVDKEKSKGNKNYKEYVAELLDTESATPAKGKSIDNGKGAGIDKDKNEDDNSYKECVAELLDTESAKSATSDIKQKLANKKVENFTVKVEEDITVIKPAEDLVCKQENQFISKVNKENNVAKAESISDAVKGMSEMENATDSTSEEDILWNVNLEDSADESIEEWSVDEDSGGDDNKNIDDDEEDENDDDDDDDGNGVEDGDRTCCRRIDKQKADNIQSVSNANENKNNEVYKRNRSGSGEEKSAENSSEEVEVEDHGVIINGQKTEYQANLELEKSVGCSESVDRAETQDSKADKALKDEKDSRPRVQRFSRRLKSKAGRRHSNVKLETKETETNTKGQSDHPGKIPVENEKFESTARKSARKRTQNLAHSDQNEKTENVKFSSPTRKSARKRTLTPKFSGFVQSKALKSLTVPSGSGVKEEPHANENYISNDDHETENSANNMETVHEKTQERKHNPGEPKQEQIKCDGYIGSTSKTKPIMKSSIIRQGIGLKSDRKIGKNKVQENLPNEGNEQVKSGPNTGTKSKGVMKNSDVHVVKRKLKENQSTENNSHKWMRHSTDIDSKNVPVRDPDKNSTQINNDSIIGEVNDTEMKNIIVRRSRKGVMMKNHIKIVKQTDNPKYHAKGYDDKEDNKKLDRTLCTEKQQQVSDDNSASRLDRVVLIDSNPQFCVNKLYKASHKDNFKNENDAQRERIRHMSANLEQSETKNSKPLKYNIDFRKMKTEKPVNLFQKEYNDFVLTRRDSNKNKAVKPDSVKDSDMLSEAVSIETSSCLNPSLKVKGKEDIPDSAKVDGNEDQVFKGSVIENDSIISSANSQVDKTLASMKESPLIVIKVKTKPDNTSKTKRPDLSRQISENTNFEIICQKKHSKTLKNSQGMNSSSNEKSSATNISEVNQDPSHGLAADRKTMEGPAVEEAVGRTLECPFCTKTFEDEKSYILHKGSQCNLTCSYCSLEFKSKDKNQFLKHVSRHETGVNFQCPDCERLFWNDTLLNVHRRIYAVEGIIKCAVCSAMFYSHFDLTVHCSAEHGTPLVYICDICSARYGSKDFLVERQFADGVLSFYSCALCESKI